MLKDVTDQNMDPLDPRIIFTWPGSTDAPGTGTDSVVGLSPITASTLNGVTTVGLDPISAGYIANGSVVKTINGYTDTLFFSPGLGIDIQETFPNAGPTPRPVTFTITNTQPGIVTATGIAPLTLTLDTETWDLSGSIAITPTDNGGAVALQAHGDPVEYQRGFAALNTLDLKWYAANTLPSYYGTLLFGRAINADITTVLKDTGTLNISDVLTACVGVGTTDLSVYDTIVLDTTTGDITGKPNKIVTFNSAGSSFIDVPVNLKNILSIGGDSTTTPGITGAIQGVQGSTPTNALIDLFRSTSTNTLPLLALGTGSFPVTADELFLLVYDGHGNALIKFHGDGVIDAKTLNADTINVTTLNADNIYVSAYEANGPTTINVTTEGPQTIIGTCAPKPTGDIVINLPDLNAFTKSLTLTVVKTDATNGQISIVNNGGSTINGSTEALALNNQYETITLVSHGIHWYKIGAM
jgi:hypothetical protein